MKKILTIICILFVIAAKTQNCIYLTQEGYKINRTTFKKGDTIVVTIYNKFAEAMSYYNLPSECYFSTGTKYNSAGYCMSDEDTRAKILLRGDSIKFSIVTTKDATYFFEFSMAPVLPAQVYECVDIKIPEKSVAEKKE